MTAAAALDRAAIEAVDQAGMLEDVLALPEQLRDALWRVEAANLEPREATSGLIVAGMGGSGIGGAHEDFPKDLARGLHRTVPQIAGSGLTAPIAYRWKTQINENAKMPAFSHEVPELDHNEIMGWQAAGEMGPFSAVFLDDSDLHPRIRQRIELTRGLIASEEAATYKVESVGTSATERLLSLVLLGDLVSLYLAVLRGVDPSPVPMIEPLKGALAGG